jgi:hypothetical protein
MWVTQPQKVIETILLSCQSEWQIGCSQRHYPPAETRDYSSERPETLRGNETEINFLTWRAFGGEGNSVRWLS